MILLAFAVDVAVVADVRFFVGFSRLVASRLLNSYSSDNRVTMNTVTFAGVKCLRIVDGNGCCGLLTVLTTCLPSRLAGSSAPLGLESRRRSRRRPTCRHALAIRGCMRRVPCGWDR